MMKRHIKAISRGGYTVIQGYFVEDNGVTITLITKNDEKRYCLHSLFSFYETDVKGSYQKEYVRI